MSTKAKKAYVKKCKSVFKLMAGVAEKHSEAGSPGSLSVPIRLDHLNTLLWYVWGLETDLDEALYAASEARNLALSSVDCFVRDAGVDENDVVAELQDANARLSEKLCAIQKFMKEVDEVRSCILGGANEHIR